MVSISEAAAVAQTNVFFTTIKDAGQSGFKWLTTNGKSIAGSVGGTASKVWTLASSFFSRVAGNLSSWFGVAKDALITAVQHLHALPNTTKGVFAVALSIAALGGALFHCCTSEAPPEAPVAENNEPEAQAPAQPEAQAPAQPEAQAPAQPEGQ